MFVLIHSLAISHAKDARRGDKTGWSTTYDALLCHFYIDLSILDTHDYSMLPDLSCTQTAT